MSTSRSNVNKARDAHNIYHKVRLSALRQLITDSVLLLLSVANSLNRPYGVRIAEITKQCANASVFQKLSKPRSSAHYVLRLTQVKVKGNTMLRELGTVPKYHSVIKGKVESHTFPLCYSLFPS